MSAWYTANGDDSKAKSAFELRVVLAAMEDDRLMEQLNEAMNDETGRLALVLENRVVDPARPSDRTTAAQASAIATAIKAVLTGFALRRVATNDPLDLARQTCLALTALAN
jgi:hypothetical protein